MTLQDVYDTLETISPLSLQEKWDNSGLIIGDRHREISQVVVSMDIDEQMISDAKRDTLFVVHHPLIFGGLSRLDFSIYPSNLLEQMILKNQSLIAMHTNFDKTHLNRYVFTEVLGFELHSSDDFICRAEGEWRGDEIINLLKEKLSLVAPKIVHKKETIKSIAMTTGAGASLMDEVGVDCFLTGDVKYHDAMKAMSQKLMMIDISHYESERYFAQIMHSELENLGISAIIMESKNPFTTEI